MFQHEQYAWRVLKDLCSFPVNETCLKVRGVFYYNKSLAGVFKWALKPVIFSIYSEACYVSKTHSLPSTENTQAYHIKKSSCSFYQNVLF